MATITITRTTVARNPLDTASPGAPAAQTPIVIDSKSNPVQVQVSASPARGMDLINLTVGESVTIAAT
jgi:hypothetical protein